MFPHDGLVLQGGGCRCFFTLGFLEAASPGLGAVRELAAVSASAAMACAHALGEHREALERFAALVRHNRRNLYPLRLLRGERPTPHHALYRAALTASLDDARLARLRAGALRVRVLLAVGPGPSRLLTTGLAVAAVLRGSPLPWLRTHVLDLGQLTRPGELVDAILASSAFPPFTPMPLRDGRAIIDGGAVEPVPLSALLRARRPLLVLTRPEPRRQLPPGLPYVAPPAPLSVATWEYADEPALRRVYEEGLRAGERFVRTGPTAVTG